jgi:hypothetical protein
MELQDILLFTRCIHDLRMTDVVHKMFMKYMCCVFFQYIPPSGIINLLKPTGYVMHQQFNIQQLYALPTLYLCVLYLSENKQ